MNPAQNASYAPDYGHAAASKSPDINEIPRLTDEIDKVIRQLGDEMNELQQRLAGVLPGPAPTGVSEPCESGRTPLGCRLISIREQIRSVSSMVRGLYTTVQV